MPNDNDTNIWISGQTPAALQAGDFAFNQAFSVRIRET